MKLKLAVVVLLALLIGAAVWYLKFSGVTHETIYGAIVGESTTLQKTVDDRYRKLDQKLDRIEGKLDRLLELATRPLPDALQPVP